MSRVEAALAAAEAGQADAEARMCDFLRIPSVSAQPKHFPDCDAAADWLCRELASLGFTAKVHATDGRPVVIGERPGPTGAGPTVLFYGHYDVQPAEPFELWTNPPFEAAIVDGPHGRRVVARGAVDDKGQVVMFLAALRAWVEATGGLPVGVRIIIEGEEEIGSPNLDPFLTAQRGALAADVALISDTDMWDIDTPALTMRLRGIAYTELLVRGADRDLHSGLYGGAALNPINALTRVLGALHNTDGRVQLPGFYDRVREPSPREIADWDGMHFDEARFLGQVRLAHPVGERGRTGLERLWARPTADVNGIWGGYTGPGSKTVIAHEARAKVSFRLVPDQDPQAVVESFRRFVAERLPPDASFEITPLGLAPGMIVDTNTRWARAALAAMGEEYGRKPVLVGSGGSIPVVESLRRLLGIDTLLMGFGLDDDNVHSPNEKFELRCFRHGLRSHVRLLGKLADAA